MNLEQYLPSLLWSAVFVGILALIAVLIVMLVRNNKQTSYEEQLEELLSDDDETLDDLGKTKVGVIQRWNRHWDTLFKNVGVTRYATDNNRAGLEVVLVAGVLAIIVSFLTKNLITGPVVGIGALYLTSALLRSRSEKKLAGINQQLPGFLFSLKANLQAASTNEQAFMKVVDSMPSPLIDNLMIVKNRILAGDSFEVGLQEMKGKATSNDLKFLAACMIQAAQAGSNLERQIDVIQGVLESRAEVEAKRRAAEQAVQPAIWLSTIIIPGFLIMTYAMNNESREFWFVHPYSWIALGITAVCYIAGILLTRKQINKIKDL